MADQEFQIRLRYARSRKRMTQEELAHAAGLNSRVDVSKYENGINEPPLDKLRRLALALDVSVDWLLGLENFLDFKGQKRKVAKKEEG